MGDMSFLSQLIRHRRLTLLAAAGLASLATAGGQAVAQDAEYVLETPRITNGSVVDDRLFEGAIDVGSSVNDTASGVALEALYSINACEGGDCPDANTCTDTGDWAPAIVTGVPPGNDISNLAGGQPYVRALHNGRFVLAWQAADGDGQGIFAQVFESDGSAMGDSFQINRYDSGEQNAVAIAPLTTGGFVASWHSSLQDESGYAVAARIFDENGDALDRDFVVNQLTEGSQMWPSISAFADDRFVVAWHSDGQDGDGRGVYMRVFDAAGLAITDEIAVTDVKASHQEFPSVHAQDGLGIVVAWTSWGQDGSGKGVYGRMFEPNQLETAWAPTTPDDLRINTTGGGDQSHATVAPLPDGGFVVTYSACVEANSCTRSDVDNYVPNNGLDIMAQRFDGDGFAIGGEFRVNQSRLSDQNCPIVSSYNDGAMVFAWCGQSADKGGGNLAEGAGDWHIYARPYNPDVTAMHDQMRVSSGELSFNPSMATLDDGRYVIVWQETQHNVIHGKIFGNVLLDADDVPHNNQDIFIQFRVDNTDDQTSWCSPVRIYEYTDPDAGNGITIDYPDVTTNEDSVLVSVTVPASRHGYRAMQLYRQTAVFADNACGVFGPWIEEGQQSTLTREVNVPLDNGTCNRFRWVVTNMLGRDFIADSANIVRTDQLPPVITVDTDQQGDQLDLDIQFADQETGVDDRTYRLNVENPVVVAEDNASVSLQLQPGTNRVGIVARDRIGNESFRDLYPNVNNAPIVLSILSPAAGGTVPENFTIIYTANRPLDGAEVRLDGNVIDDLEIAGLAPGAHVVTITGIDLVRNEAVNAQSNFTVENDFFSSTLISPQAVTYETDSIQVVYQATDDVSDAFWSLDGGPISREPVLEDLPDGHHTFTHTVETADGRSYENNVEFDVELVLPTLVVTSPVGGDVVPAERVTVQFETNADVTFKLDGVDGGAINSGDFIEIAEAGAHTLILTATHASGSEISESIGFTVDLQPLELDIGSPAPTLYAQDVIPIEYDTNKELISVEIIVDGNVVEGLALTNLPDGAHHLEITGEDKSGRVVTSVVDFQTATLRLLSPVADSLIISNLVPPRVEFLYEASDFFNNVTRSWGVRTEHPQQGP